MGGRATNARSREPEKTSPAARDERGRFKAGCSGNPRGAQPLTPERRAVRDLAAAERAPNIATLVSIRDSSKDPWVRLEACKLLLMYSDGKPVTAAGPMVAVQVNQGSASPTFGAHSEPVDAVVSLATEGHLMSDEQREAIVSSVFARANTAASRVSRRPAIEAPPPATAESEGAENPAPAGAPPPVATCAAPEPSGVVLEGSPPAQIALELGDNELEYLRRMGGGPPPSDEPLDESEYMTLDEALAQMEQQERTE